ncbi:hypothetical protein D9M68_813310 [compost metagenome]
MRRYFAKEARAARAGAGVDPATQILDEGDQALAWWEVTTAEKNKVFEKVRQPRVLGRLIMAATANLHQRGGQIGSRLSYQTHPQAIGQVEIQGQLRFCGFD